LIPNYQILCPKCTQWLRQDATADSGINNQLIKMHCTRSWITCVLSSSISYFVLCSLQHKIFNTTKLLHQMALCQINNKKVSNLILTVTA